ncbi:hypothetical protein DM860_010263 [Cuscuta australis]|uniref:Nudix hydrolase domain-containing protein n=1 Tax=Cuscuta australis TaxID=267555 RepID=A0A328DAV0_9ASTE|nr:hypothetical protein DM860_010263 [Cuscuta australis]
MQLRKMDPMAASRTGRHLQRYNVQGCRQVVGCIPYRYRKTKQSSSSSSIHGTSPVDDLEFLLVSSQKSPRMMFPKGGWELDESLEEAALRETFEEAGIYGEVGSCLGKWFFKSKSLGVLHEGYMLPLVVLEELEEWPEKDVRQRLWVSYSEAMEACFHPWMKEALDLLVTQLRLDKGVENKNKNSLEAIKVVEEPHHHHQQIVIEILVSGDGGGEEAATASLSIVTTTTMTATHPTRTEEPRTSCSIEFLRTELNGVA